MEIRPQTRSVAKIHGFLRLGIWHDRMFCWKKERTGEIKRFQLDRKVGFWTFVVNNLISYACVLYSTLKILLWLNICANLKGQVFFHKDEIFVTNKFPNFYLNFHFIFVVTQGNSDHITTSIYKAFHHRQSISCFYFKANFIIVSIEDNTAWIHTTIKLTLFSED